MGNESDALVSRGDLMRAVADLRREVNALKTARRSEHTFIGSGGIRVRGGSIVLDEDGDIIVRGGQIIAGDPEGFHARTTSTGYQLVNEDGEVDMDLTVGGPNQIRLRGEGAEGQDNEILLTSSGEINGRVLNVDEINLDGQSLSSILDVLATAATDNPPDTEPPPPSGTLTTSYRATFSRSYRGNGARNDFTPNGGLTQGFYTSNNGNQRSIIGFPQSQIASDHSGRTITRVRVWLRYGHWHHNSGGTAILGHHSHTSAPSTFSASATNVVQSPGWPKPGSRWVTYSHSMQEWLTGAKRGIVLGPGPSTSRLYYGWAYSHTHSNVNGRDWRPRIEIRSVA